MHLVLCRRKPEPPGGMVRGSGLSAADHAELTQIGRITITPVERRTRPGRGQASENPDVAPDHQQRDAQDQAGEDRETETEDASASVAVRSLGQVVCCGRAGLSSHGVVAQFRLGRGKVIVSTFDIEQYGKDLFGTRVVDGLIRYLASDECAPTTVLE